MISLKEVKSKLDIDSIKNIVKGTSRNTFLLKSKNKRYVLKLHDKEEKRDLQKKINYLKKINSKKEITVNPINDKVLEFEDAVGYYYEYFEGVHYTNAKIPNKLFRFGEIVGEFSRVTKDLEPTIKSNSYEETAIRKSKEWVKKEGPYTDLIEKGLKLTEKLRKKKYRSQIIHGDLHFDNVIYNKKTKEYRIIDVSTISKGILAREISVMISYALSNSSEENKKVITKLLEGYESKFKLTKKEKQAMPALMVLRKIGEIKWLLKQLNSKKIKRKDFDRWAGGSVKQLKIITSHFEELEKTFV